jgi:hypothetical protein
MIGRIVGRYPAGSTLAGKEQGEMGEAERRVKETDELMRETVIRLSRSGPSELLGATAHEAVLGLKPHLKEALAALADIERRRGSHGRGTSPMACVQDAPGRGPSFLRPSC